MKLIIAVCLVSTVGLCLAKPEQQYTDRYDNLDLDEILANQRLRTPYIKCLLNQGKCSVDGKELKSHIKEALENKCGKCTPTQKSGTRKVIGYLVNNDEENWNKLSALYDPSRKFTTLYESELKRVRNL